MPYVKETTHLAGPLTITVQHECPPCPINGYDDPWAFERSGEPSIWGSGLEHQTVHDGTTLGAFSGSTLKLAAVCGGIFLAGIWALGRKRRR